MVGTSALLLQLAGDGSLSGGGLLALSATPPRLHCWREGLSSTSPSLFLTLRGAPNTHGILPGCLSLAFRVAHHDHQAQTDLLPDLLLFIAQCPSYGFACSVLPDSTPLLELVPHILQLHHFKGSFFSGSSCVTGLGPTGMCAARARLAQQWKGQERGPGRPPPSRKMLRETCNGAKRRTRQVGWLAGGWWGLGTRSAVWEAGELYR